MGGGRGQHWPNVCWQSGRCDDVSYLSRRKRSGERPRLGKSKWPMAGPAKMPVSQGTGGQYGRLSAFA